MCVETNFWEYRTKNKKLKTYLANIIIMNAILYKLSREGKKVYKIHSIIVYIFRYFFKDKFIAFI